MAKKGQGVRDGGPVTLRVLLVEILLRDLAQPSGLLRIRIGFGWMICTMRVPGERPHNGANHSIPHRQAMEGGRVWLGCQGGGQLCTPSGLILIAS